MTTSGAAHGAPTGAPHRGGRRSSPSPRPLTPSATPPQHQHAHELTPAGANPAKRWSFTKINTLTQFVTWRTSARIGDRTARGRDEPDSLPAQQEGLCNHSANCAQLLSQEPRAIRSRGFKGPAEAHTFMKAAISSLQDFKRKPLRASKLSTQPKAAVERLPTCSYCYRIHARQTADLQLEEVFVGLSSAAY